ncbi:hypothetical protein CAP35_08245 [Chitinophagaceae bacterium IBVUCB1]|nr:hypothetical protein CAP35_08245 [Chitinophagaceae bacterium IBVUCB1]
MDKSFEELEENARRMAESRRLAEEARQRQQAGETYVSDFRHLLPELFNALPAVLSVSLDTLQEQQEKEAFLVGALGVLSGCMPNVYGYYMGDAMRPNLYCYVLGRYGLGKGVLGLARQLGEPIHQHKLEQAKQMRKDYIFQKDVYEQQRKLYEQGKRAEPPTPPDEPRMLRLFMPANSTKAALIMQMEQNDGRGIIFETESDSLADMLRSGDNNFSDILRKAFHHETVSLVRKTNREECEIAAPEFSIVLSGTHDQLSQLIPSAENGLFSRFFYYIIEGTDNFLFPFLAERNIRKQVVSNMGMLWMHVYKQLEALEKPIEFCLTEAQQQRFAATMAERKRDIRNNISDKLDGTIHRMGNIFFRICMILTMLRRMDKEQAYEGTIVCEDTDFELAFDISVWLLQYSLKVFEEVEPIRPTSVEQIDLTKYSSTINQKDECCELCARGWSIRQIAKHMYGGAKTTTIYNWIKNYCPKRKRA